VLVRHDLDVGLDLDNITLSLALALGALALTPSLDYEDLLMYTYLLIAK